MLKSTIIPQLASDTLKEASECFSEHNKLSDEILLKLHSVFGETFTAATQLLENTKIVQYQIADKSRSVYKVGAHLERYTIYNDVNFCQCEDFKTRVLEEGTSFTCKHVLGFQINKIVGAIKVSRETVTDSQLVEFLNEQLNLIND